MLQLMQPQGFKALKVLINSSLLSEVDDAGDNVYLSAIDYPTGNRYRLCDCMHPRMYLASAGLMEHFHELNEACILDTSKCARSNPREQRKPVLRAAQQAEQTIASGICDMTTLANTDADEIHASLSALGLMVAKVAVAQVHPGQDGAASIARLLYDQHPLHRTRKLQAASPWSAMW